MLEKEKTANQYGIISSTEKKSVNIFSDYSNTEFVILFVFVIVLVGSYFGLKAWHNSASADIQTTITKQQCVLSELYADEQYREVAAFSDKVRGLKYVLDYNKQSFFENYSPLAVIDKFSQTLHRGVTLDSIAVSGFQFDESSLAGSVTVAITATVRGVDGKDVVQIIGEQELLWRGRDEEGALNVFPWLSMREFNPGNYEVADESAQISASFTVMVGNTAEDDQEASQPAGQDSAGS